VKCSHGATVGRIDDEQLFYLRSRGIDQQAAQQMILYAFAAELTEAIAMMRSGSRCWRVLASVCREASMTFSVNGTRGFSGSDREVNGQPLAYLDSAASAQKPRR
jgi:hypothetical protein